ncbi:MAG: universal stress protein, partial [Pseudomonadales bacterium]|nr:universal stress protein [Pseudomonadales bacterium]
MAEGIERIVVPMDGSEASLRAYRLAKALAGASGMELHLLHVHPVERGAATGMAHLSGEAFARASADAGSRAFLEAGDEIDAEHRHVCWGEPV